MAHAVKDRSKITLLLRIIFLNTSSGNLETTDVDAYNS